MGTRRDIDSGRFDTLGRKIKESRNKRKKRARQERDMQKAIEDFHRLATEFNSEVNNAVEYGMRDDPERLEKSARRAAYLYSVYQQWSDEVGALEYEDGQKQYDQFRSKYGLNSSPGTRIRINTKEFYNNLNQQSIQETHEAIYDVLNSKYSDQFSQEEMNNYKEKVYGGRPKERKQDSSNPQSSQDQSNKERSRSQAQGRQEESHGAHNHKDSSSQKSPREEKKQSDSQSDSRAENQSGSRAESQSDRQSEDYQGNSNRQKSEKNKPPRGEEEGHQDPNRAKYKSQNFYSKFAQNSSAKNRANQNFRGSGREPMFRQSGGVFSAIENLTGLNNHGGFRVTWRPRLGPFVMNMGRKGPSSVSAAVGPLRYMVWQKNRGIGAWFSSYDLPSFLSFRGNRK